MLERSFSCRACRRKTPRSQNVGSKCCSQKCYDSLIIKTGRCEKCKPVVASDGVTVCSVCRRKIVTEIEQKSRELRSISNVYKHLYGKSFYTSYKWLYVKDIILKTHPHICVICKATKVNFHVDHIKPKSKYPELAYTLSNLRILCAGCNLEKGDTE